VPDKTAVYAIGDIHGRDDLLAELRRLIEIDAGARGMDRRVIVHVGDYVDRGPHSRTVLDQLIGAPLAGFQSVHLKGNHEDMMLRFLADPGEGALWLLNGGDATLQSYGIAADTPVLRGPALGKLHRALIRRLPRAHLAFLEGLALDHREGDYLFVHAGIRPGLALDRQAPEDQLWIREPFLGWTGDHGVVVVHGHTPAPEPEIRANRIGIDTGAFYSGRLTCVVLEGGGRRFLSTG
jgi:serine/threonine protein phosphatase 1